jgi:hypothetical protein
MMTKRTAPWTHEMAKRRREFYEKHGDRLRHAALPMMSERAALRSVLAHQAYYGISRATTQSLDEEIVK